MKIINPELVKKYGPTDHSYDSNLICKLILPVQMQYLGCLGSEFISSLVSQIESGNISADNKLLLEDYIWPLLSWGIVNLGTYPNSIRASNAGNVRLNGHHFEPATVEELGVVKHSYKAIIDSFYNGMLIFLAANKEKYPLYPPNISACAAGCSDNHITLGIIGVTTPESTSKCDCK